MWGKNFPEKEKAYEELREFDNRFIILCAGIPNWIMKIIFKKTLICREKSINRLFHFDQLENECELINSRHQWFKSDKDIASSKGGIELEFLWATQANSAPASFWALINIMRDPKAKESVMKELEIFLKDKSVNQYVEELKNLVTLDSVISEVLRLYTASISFREARKDGVIKSKSGLVYEYKQGENIALPSTEVQFDSEIYQNPHEFKYDRFLSQTKFYKNGLWVSKHEMAFGGGVSLCPGRNFAKNEIKLFVAIMLLNFDLELGNEIPSIHLERFGLGVYPPLSDVTFKYKLK